MTPSSIVYVQGDQGHCQEVKPVATQQHVKGKFPVSRQGKSTIMTIIMVCRLICDYMLHGATVRGGTEEYMQLLLLGQRLFSWG